MKNKVLYPGINFLIGVSLLFIGTKGLKPNFILNQEEQIALGIFFTATGLVMLVWRISRLKNENILLGSTIIIGLLLLVSGIILMSKNSLYGISVIAPGFILFLRSFVILLKKKFPNQEFFGKKQ
ncbi:MAG: hypothetical protein Q7R84_00525 [bacterium]|nr:hypothetical protein [bacterium]